MMNTVFEKYHSRLVAIGVTKALIGGFITGFAVSFAIAFVAWFFEFNGIWASIGVGIVVIIATTTVYYFKLFRPTTKKMAKLLDRLGLEERIITMTELEKDESYIAMLQREDAKEKLKTVDAKSLKFNLSVRLIIALAILGMLSTSMMAITSLSAQGILPSGSEVIGELIPPSPEDYVEVTYIAGDGGNIIGEPEQLVFKGDDAESVVAVASDGWIFKAWDDGWSEPERHDTNLSEDLNVTAIFIEIGDGENDASGALGDDEGEGETDVPGDQPGQGEGEGSTDGDGEGSGQEAEDGEGESGEGKTNSTNGGSEEGGRGENDQKPDESQPSQGSDGYELSDNNFVIDGKTDYHTVTDFEEEQKKLAEDNTLPPELRDLISGYLDSLRP